MSVESLEKLGLFFDELKRIRVWEPEVAERTNDLKDESKDFVNKVKEFHNISSEFISLIKDLGKQVEQEKIKALGSSNALKSMAKQREYQQQQYQEKNSPIVCKPLVRGVRVCLEVKMRACWHLSHISRNNLFSSLSGIPVALAQGAICRGIFNTNLCHFSIPSALLTALVVLASSLISSASKSLKENGEPKLMRSLIMEKTAELERLKVQHQSLLKVQSEQQEMIHQIQLY